MDVSPGDHIRVRGRQWMVEDVTAFRDCAVLSLSRSDGRQERRTCRLLLPFDRPVKVRRRLSPKRFSLRAWMPALLDTVTRAHAFGELRALDAAAITVHPFQLEPVLALITGRASRLLLADEVGLGKTIQAGLILAELRDRGWCERALVITPAGLRRQWIDELHRRFSIVATTIDAAALTALSNRLPIDVNPWDVEPVVVTSIDFVKQPDVLRALQRPLWDVLIVDEAHQATAGSLRYAAIQAVAVRSRHVVLLTATPHGGNESDYRALCDIGKLDADDRIVLFRRTRQQTRLHQTRRVHLLPIRPTAREQGMHQLLSRYAARLWNIGRREGRRDAQIVAMVLAKRAFSSAQSLALSLDRRLALCGNTHRPSEPLLPFDVDLDALDALPEMAAAGFDDLDEECAVLKELLHVAREAAVGEAKMRAVRRLLRRIDEPLIVFTEYRDTLDTLQAVIERRKSVVALHGGKSLDERRAAVESFTRGAADVLLATDAGSEGLNLHERCRAVINLELPWSPMRLEQRIGRVDRIGQQRTVHVFNLIAQDTAERTVLAALLQRLDRIQASDIEIAASVLTRTELPVRGDSAAPPSYVSRIDLTGEAANEAARVETARKRVHASGSRDASRIPVAFLESGAVTLPDDALTRNGFIWFVRCRIAAGTGRIVDETIVPIATTVRDVLRRGDMRSAVKHAIVDLAPAVIDFASQLADARARWLKPQLAEWSTRALKREKSLLDRVRPVPECPLQTGLFDSRAVRLRELAERERNAVADAAIARAEHIAAACTPFVAQPPELVLLLMVGRC